MNDNNDTVKTVGELRALLAVLDQLPDTAQIVIENRCDGWRFELIHAHAYGTRTLEPFLQLLTRHEGCQCAGIPEPEIDEDTAAVTVLKPSGNPPPIAVTAVRVRVPKWPAVVVAVLGSFGVASWISTGNNFWTVGVPSALLLVSGAYVVLRGLWRR